MKMETKTQRALKAVKTHSTALPHQLLAGFLRRDGQLNICSRSALYTSRCVLFLTKILHEAEEPTAHL